VKKNAGARRKRQSRGVSQSRTVARKNQDRVSHEEQNTDVGQGGEKRGTGIEGTGHHVKKKKKSLGKVLKNKKKGLRDLQGERSQQRRASRRGKEENTVRDGKVITLLSRNLRKLLSARKRSWGRRKEPRVGEAKDRRFAGGRSARPPIEKRGGEGQQTGDPGFELIKKIQMGQQGKEGKCPGEKKGGRGTRTFQFWGMEEEEEGEAWWKQGRHSSG